MRQDRILVIDRDDSLASLVRRALGRQGSDIRRISSPDQLGEMRSWRPDEIIVDLDDETDACRRLGQCPLLRGTPVIAVAESASLADRCAALAAGALDLLAKPPDLLELLFKIEAHQRLARRGAEEVVRYGDLSLDARAGLLYLPAREIPITPTEVRILLHLVALGGKPAPVNSILEEVFDQWPGCGDPDLVRWHVRNLRRKVETDPRAPERILTLRGAGYRLRRIMPAQGPA